MDPHGEAVRQVIFHDTFGTHVEDFGILADVTNNKTGTARHSIPKEAFQAFKLATGTAQAITHTKWRQAC
jgi:hypothetical protein